MIQLGDTITVGVAGVLFRGGIFLDDMVGGDGGVMGPKELVGWVGTPQTSGLTLLPHHTSPRLKHSFLPRVDIL